MTSKKVIVSACLAGLNCRYDCASETRAEIVKMVESGEALPLCPEQLGGLPTPRPPAEIQDNLMVKDVNGLDVTNEFNQGAEEALKLVELVNASEAYLKSKSPMCGVGKIYDGTFKGKLKDGDGIFTQLLKKLNIKIHSID